MREHYHKRVIGILSDQNHPINTLRARLRYYLGLLFKLRLAAADAGAKAVLFIQDTDAAKRYRDEVDQFIRHLEAVECIEISFALAKVALLKGKLRRCAESKDGGFKFPLKVHLKDWAEWHAKLSDSWVERGPLLEEDVEAALRRVPPVLSPEERQGRHSPQPLD